MAERIELALDPALPATAKWCGEGVAVTPIDACARWSFRLPPLVAQRLAQVAGLQIAMPINRCAFDRDRLAARLGPDEWLLCAPLGAAQEFERELAAALGSEAHALVDVSHRYAALSVEGPRATALLAAGCPLDLHPKAFAAGTATRTLLGKAEIVLWRLHDAPAYRVECARSYAAYVHAFLREAGREFAPAA